MKKLKKILPLILMLILLASCFAGCNIIRSLLGLDGEFKLAVGDITLEIGEERTIEAASDSQKGLTFYLSSSDTTKVSVDGKVITAQAVTDEPVVVTATASNGNTVTFKVTVSYASIGSLQIQTSGTLMQVLNSDDISYATAVNYTAVTNEGVDPATVYNWAVFKKGETTAITTSTGKSFSFTPAEIGQVYVVRVVAGEQSAEKETGAFYRVFISTDKTSYRIGGTVTVNVKFYKTTTLGASSVTLYENGVSVGSKSLGTVYGTGIKNASFTVSFEDIDADKELYVVYNGVQSNTVTIAVADFAAADHISIEPSSAAALKQSGVVQAVTFTATVSPTNANTASIDWYVNDEPAEASGKTFTFTPPDTTVKEYHVEAKIDKISSGYVTIVRYNSAISGYLNEVTSYGGYSQNAYVTSQRELNNIIVDAIENQKYEGAANAIELYIGYGTSFSSEDMEERLSIAQGSCVEAGVLAGPFREQNTLEPRKLSIFFEYNFDDDTTHEENIDITLQPTRATSGASAKSQNTSYPPNYTEHTGADRTLYIDTVTRTMDVTTTNMLYKAVQWGYKPTITGTNSTAVNTVYTAARKVLNSIITDDMTEYQKVLAIYDWIIYNVAYDHDLANLTVNGVSGFHALNEKMSYYGYYLEGVFLNSNRRAVCDGKSKAFVLLCGMEGLTSIRVSGTAGSGGSYGGHAWNKVLLDVNNDGYKEWFVVDSTWDDATVGNKEVLRHEYFLVTDSSISSSHTEDTKYNYPAATTSYDTGLT